MEEGIGGDMLAHKSTYMYNSSQNKVISFPLRGVKKYIKTEDQKTEISTIISTAQLRS